ncbi:probable sodium-coupled neutral amino acid transporter 6 isoform X3 [Dunckerocampus dactyliophorus]|uniref:probable sodium-coupled neutral amino acid transporter 6 isoform X3 n=1 Tax=Dunckerocampus dactyliophorus TaxID=161453 RepID=UPI0024054013|nr:probable sodium-coupled neutral amino acid transporter 6 isoform X3 [Dunckerocampus dactyliophorus]
MSINGNANTEVTDATPLLSNQSRSKGASFASSVFNLMNAIMGSGILGLAYAMASTGIVGFCVLLVLVSSLAGYSIHLLLKLCDQTGINSYEDLGGRALQKPGKVLVAVAILIQNVGAMSSYLFILKSELPAAITSFLSPDQSGQTWYQDGRLLLILITLCVILPLAILPKIGFLGYTSSLAFFFMLYFAIVVVVKKWSIPCPLPQNVTTFLGVYQVSNSSDSDCTPKLFVISSRLLSGGLRRGRKLKGQACLSHKLTPSKARMQNVTNVSISLSFLVYLVSALFGYLTFYAHVDSELLLGYDAYMPRDILVMTVRLAILIAVLLTVPLIHFPARKATILLLRGNRPFSWPIHITTTVVILGTVLMLAIFVPDIRNVFGVVGSTTSSCLLFVFPGIFYLKIGRQPLPSFDSVGAMALVVFGLIMGIISFSIIIFTWIQSS